MSGAESCSIDYANVVDAFERLQEHGEFSDDYCAEEFADRAIRCFENENCAELEFTFIENGNEYIDLCMDRSGNVMAFDYEAMEWVAFTC